MVSDHVSSRAARARRLTFFFGEAVAFGGGQEFHTCTPGFRQADRDCLPRISHPVLPFSDVMNFLANNLACLSVGSFPHGHLRALSMGLFFPHKTTPEE